MSFIRRNSSVVSLENLPIRPIGSQTPTLYTPLSCSSPLVPSSEIATNATANTFMSYMKEFIYCPNDIVAGYLISKDPHISVHGRVAGGSGFMNTETYQRDKIEQGTQTPCDATDVRINKRTGEMLEIVHPMKYVDGFDYTENFDGMQQFGEHMVWINMKSVIGKGGSQTRTLRDECYPFIEAQLNYLLKTQSTTYFFANILDGDEAASKMLMFQYLLDLPEFVAVKKYIYVGDLKKYFEWLKTTVFVL
jgi:hypothetical protein